MVSDRYRGRQTAVEAEGFSPHRAYAGPKEGGARGLRKSSRPSGICVSVPQKTEYVPHTSGTSFCMQ